MSLLHGWLPTAVQILAALAVGIAVLGRSRRWRRVWIPVSGLAGGALALAVYLYLRSAGLIDDTNPAPWTLWLWIALSGMTFGGLLTGLRGARWWQRTARVTALPLCALCTALVLNIWVGYFPTLQTAWDQFTTSPLPDQTDLVAVSTARQEHQLPRKGSVVAVDIPPTNSGFRHRQEFVYLPPAWFADSRTVSLPAVMMIGGEFNTPADWLRAGRAIETLDTFAAAHHGYAPVFVFADPGGTFDNDTECVNGPRGNSADHLVRDVVPYVESHFGVSTASPQWAVAGFSMGGTCAVDLAVMHPDVFGAFLDIAGDAAPNAGTRSETIARLFAGNEQSYLSFDPATVMTRHGPYVDLAGWFDVNGPVFPTAQTKPNDQAVAARSLCSAGTGAGIDCAVVSRPGNHDWPFASRAFTAALPWLAGRLGTPGAPQIDLPATARGVA
ncbi:alpha/beta hydrolase [Mycolicibacterium vaccae]|uniref:alpha/beta hydrolase n=1 Tax=Mycolicibacterium vaccae TaxID=1810 RepID=UPI003CEF3075